VAANEGHSLPDGLARLFLPHAQSRNTIHRLLTKHAVHIAMRRRSFLASWKISDHEKDAA
jgi:hypothetical protein